GSMARTYVPAGRRMMCAPPKSLAAMIAERSETLPLSSCPEPSRVASTVSSNVSTMKTAGAVRSSSVSRDNRAARRLCREAASGCENQRRQGANLMKQSSHGETEGGCHQEQEL